MVRRTIPADVLVHFIRPEEILLRAIETLNKVNPQFCLVVDDSGRLLGTLTDGDIRRGILSGASLQDPVRRVMFQQPVTASPEDSLEKVRILMRSRHVKFAPLVDSTGAVVGVQTLEAFGPAERDNWVVLMAGGLGERLRPLTDDCPKPLLHVGLKPLLEIIIENLSDQGFHRFFLAVNYKSEMFEEHFGDGSRWGATVAYLRESRRMGTAGPLALLPERPQTPLLVMNADLLTSINFGQLLDFHRETKARATMCVREYDFEVPYGVVRLEGNRMTGIDEKPVQRFFVNAGIYVLEPDVLELLKPHEPCDMPVLFERILAAGGETAAFPICEYWLDIGRHTDLKQAKEDVSGLFKEIKAKA